MGLNDENDGGGILVDAGACVIVMAVVEAASFHGLASRTVAKTRAL